MNENRHLIDLENKLQMARDFTAAVATGRATGLALHGRGGIGKSREVLGELERLEVPYRLYNSRMTGRALYNTLERSPDAIHILEDMEQLLNDKGALGVLRSALWAQTKPYHDGPLERLVTWSTHLMEHSFIFTGGIILIANRPFPDKPELDAIKTRVIYHQLIVSDNELIAKMRHIASQGYKRGRDKIDPDDCLEICNHIIDECRGLNRALDLRLLINGFADFLLWQDCASGCHWRDLVSARIKERPTRLEHEPKHAGNRAAQRESELQTAAEIADLPREERRDVWASRTGKSEQTLYRRLEEVKSQGRLNFTDADIAKRRN